MRIFAIMDEMDREHYGYAPVVMSLNVEKLIPYLNLKSYKDAYIAFMDLEPNDIFATACDETGPRKEGLQYGWKKYDV